MSRLNISVIKNLFLFLTIYSLFLMMVFFIKPVIADDVLNGNNGSSVDSGCSDELNEALKSLKSYEKNATVLIGLVPDPIDSQVGWLFDGQLEAMINAVTSVTSVTSINDSETYKTKYLRDITVLPWKCAAEARLSIVNQPFLFSPQLQNSRYKESIINKRTPGLIVFRSNDPKQSPLILLLVGESPIWGLQPQAFRKALELSDEYSNISNKYSIVGPTFSGTRSSLRTGIEDWSRYNSKKNFNIISGSASAVDNKTYLEKPYNGQNDLHVTFSATVIPSDVLLDDFFKYLKEEFHIIIKDDVVILAESDTAYGSDGSDILNDKDSNDRPQVFRFPMQIGRTRSAVESKDVKGVQSAYASFLEQEQLNSRGILKLPLDNFSSAGDGLPAFDAGIQSVSDSMVIADLMNMFIRKPFKFVGIQATDIRDKLFLIKQIRESFPGVNVFTTEADIFLTHPDFYQFTKDTLVASSYRLSETNGSNIILKKDRDNYDQDNNSFSYQDRVIGTQFPRSMAVGTYNAVLAVMGYHDLIEYAFQKIEKRLPAIHLLGVGKNGLWPIKRKSYSNNDKYTYVNDNNENSNDKGNSNDRDKNDFKEGDVVIDADVSLTRLILWLTLCVGCGVWNRTNIQSEPTEVKRFFLFLSACMIIPFIISICYVQWVSIWSSLIPDVDKYVSLFLFRTSTVEFSGLTFLPSFALQMMVLIFLFEYLIRVKKLKEMFVRNPDSEKFVINLDFDWTRDYVNKKNSLLKDLIQSTDINYLNNIKVTKCIFVLFILGVYYVVLVPFVNYFPGSITDPRPVYSIMVFIFLTIIILIVLNIVRFFIIWTELKGFLNQCSIHPLIWSFNRLPRRISGWIEWRLFDKQYGVKEIDATIAQYNSLLSNHFDRLIAQMTEATSKKIMIKRKITVSPNVSETRKNRIRAALENQKIIQNRLERHWKELPVRIFPWEVAITKDAQPILWDPVVGDTPPAETVALYMLSVTHERHVWLKLAEDYAALHVARQIHYTLCQLWMLIKYLIVGLLLLLASVSSYNFQPNKYIDVLLFLLISVVLGGVTLFIISINRSDVISRILKSKPNKLTPDQAFVLQMLTYVVIPICGVVAYYMPSLSGLFGWVSTVFSGGK